jgi:hypothetical protein
MAPRSFTAAVLVTPLGALSVVICAILSHIFLKVFPLNLRAPQKVTPADRGNAPQETLTFFGWIGCFLCIVGSITIALNAPEQQSVTEIRPFMHLFIAPGFLAWLVVMVLLALAGVFYFEPRVRRHVLEGVDCLAHLIRSLTLTVRQAHHARSHRHLLGHRRPLCQLHARPGRFDPDLDPGQQPGAPLPIQSPSQRRADPSACLCQVTFWFFWFLFVFVGQSHR